MKSWIEYFLRTLKKCLAELNKELQKSSEPKKRKVKSLAQTGELTSSERAAWSHAPMPGDLELCFNSLIGWQEAPWGHSVVISFLFRECMNVGFQKIYACNLIRNVNLEKGRHTPQRGQQENRQILVLAHSDTIKTVPWKCLITSWSLCKLETWNNQRKKEKKKPKMRSTWDSGIIGTDYIIIYLIL